VYINDWTSPSASVLFFSFAINVIQWVLLSIVTEPSHEICFSARDLLFSS
jgi:hypothetical protein